MKVGSLFSGIGGFELGLQMASPDFEIAWQVEQDEFCQKILAKHWPDVRRWDDVRTFPPDPVEDWAVDLVCGGFPCQPVSLAGKQKGEEDERWLWDDMRRVCDTLRPRWVLAENVQGLLSASDGLGRRGALFGTVLRDLAEIGYRVEWHCVPAYAVGSPQIRERIWIIGHRDVPDVPLSRGREQKVGGDDVGVGRQWVTSDDLQSAVRGTAWSSECRLGVHADGVSTGMGECLGWECGIPRVIPNQPNRLKRIGSLKSLGNSVIPQIVEMLGRVILRVESANK